MAKMQMDYKKSAMRTWAEQVVTSISGSVGYISYPMFIDPMITRVPLGFSGYIWLDNKNCVDKKCSNLNT